MLQADHNKREALLRKWGFTPRGIIRCTASRAATWRCRSSNQFQPSIAEAIGTAPLRRPGCSRRKHFGSGSLAWMLAAAIEREKGHSLHGAELNINQKKNPKLPKTLLDDQKPSKTAKQPTEKPPPKSNQ